MENRRTVSILIPYRLNGKEYQIYLQKKSKDAPRSPGWFGYWGGGTEEGETPGQTLEREIEEELGIKPKDYKYFGKYEQKTIKNVYTIEVDNDFEKQIKISEGDYGKWFSKDEALNEPKFGEGDKIVVKDFYKSILK